MDSSRTTEANGNGSAIVRAVPSGMTAPVLTKEALKLQAQQRKLLASYIRSQMVEGTDYGKIPGTEKPTLLKPGAEKLVELFRCTPEFEIVHRVEDFEHDFFHYMFRVRLVQRDAAAVVAEGYGSANSRESRYRWRNANLKCPDCGSETLFKSKRDPEYYCWTKKGGCGAKFDWGDERVEKQPLGKVQNDDVATLANTILKMAKKRAMVDGAIALARCSDMFTQDVEDLADPSHAADDGLAPEAKPRRDKKTDTPPQSARPSPPRADSQSQDNDACNLPPTLTPAQQAHGARIQNIWRRAQAVGVGRERFPRWVLGELNTDTPSKDWTDEQMARLESALADAERVKRAQ